VRFVKVAQGISVSISQDTLDWKIGNWEFSEWLIPKHFEIWSRESTRCNAMWQNLFYRSGKAWWASTGNRIRPVSQIYFLRVDIDFRYLYSCTVAVAFVQRKIVFTEIVSCQLQILFFNLLIRIWWKLKFYHSVLPYSCYNFHKVKW